MIISFSFVTSIVCLLFFPISVRAENRVIGVLFVTNESTVTRQMEDAVLHQLKFVQRQWLINFGRTFQLDAYPLRVIHGDHHGAWYAETPSSEYPGNTRNPRWYRLENIREELIRKLHLTADVRMLVYPTTVYNCQVGAYTGVPPGHGGYMDFDDITCVYGAGKSIPYYNHAAVCGTHEMHEMGHVFGLEHEGPSEDCMQQGFYEYLNLPHICSFDDRNRQIVLSTQRSWLPLTSLDEDVDNGSSSPSAVPTSTSAPKLCDYTDACDQSKKIYASVGDTITDSCGDMYIVHSDRCDLKYVPLPTPTPSPTSSSTPTPTSTPSPTKTSTATPTPTQTQTLCQYTDECDETIQIFGKTGGTITDSCGNTYIVINSDCDLKYVPPPTPTPSSTATPTSTSTATPTPSSTPKICQYTDACDGTQLFGKVGGMISDSCGRTYAVKDIGCHLERL